MYFKTRFISSPRLGENCRKKLGYIGGHEDLKHYTNLIGFEEDYQEDGDTIPKWLFYGNRTCDGTYSENENRWWNTEEILKNSYKD